MISDLVTFNPGAPVSNTKLGLILGLALFLIFLFFITPILRKKTTNKALKKVIAKSRGGLMGYALGIFVLVWLRLETVPFLSTRLWMVVLLFSFALWSIWKIVLYRKIKNRIQNAEARRRRQ